MARSYHFGTRRLSFLKNRTILAVAGDCPDIRSACRGGAGVDDCDQDPYLHRPECALAGSNMLVSKHDEPRTPDSSVPRAKRRSAFTWSDLRLQPSLRALLNVRQTRSRRVNTATSSSDELERACSVREHRRRRTNRAGLWELVDTPPHTTPGETPNGVRITPRGGHAAGAPPTDAQIH